MSLLLRLQNVIQDTTFLMIQSNRVFRQALADINAAPPTYTADKLVRDVTQLWLKSLIVGMRLSKPLADPLLPTATISAPAGTIPGNLGLNEVASIADSIPLGAAITVTPCVFLGWSQVPAVNDPKTVDPLPCTSPVPAADLDPLRQQITVRLNVPIGTVVEQGTYQGFVLVGAVPVAIVIVRAL